MSSFDEHVLNGFHDELRKIALSLSGVRGGLEKAVSLAGHAGNLGGIGAAGGGLIGAGVGGYRGYQQAKEQGQQGVGAVFGALGGAGRGAAIGAGAGGAAGLAGGAALGHFRPELAQKALEVGRSIPGGGYGQRMAHTLTGWTPKGGIGELGMGAKPLQERLRAATTALEDLEQERGMIINKNYTPDIHKSLIGKVRRGIFGAEGDLERHIASRQKEIGRLEKAVPHAERAEELGLSSMPGYLKGMATHPLDTLKSSLGQRWHSEGTMGKAMLLGLPAYFGAQEMMNKDDPRGMGEKALSAAGGMVGSMAFAPMTITGEILAGMGTQQGMAGAGRLIDKARGASNLNLKDIPSQYKGPTQYRPGHFRQPTVTTADRAEEQTSTGTTAPTERYETARYRGEAPEGLGS